MPEDHDTISTSNYKPVLQDQNLPDASSGTKDADPDKLKEINKNETGFNFPKKSVGSGIGDNIGKLGRLSENAIDQGKSKPVAGPDNKDEQVKIQGPKLRGVKKSYKKRWWSGVTLTSGGGLALGIASAAGIALGVGTLGVGFLVGGVLAAVGGAGLMGYVAVKYALEPGRQRLRDQWMKENKNWLTDDHQKNLSNIRTDQWNEVLNFRVKRRRGGFARTGFTDAQREVLTDYVMRALRNGTSAADVARLVGIVNREVRKPNFDFYWNPAIRELRTSSARRDGVPPDYRELNGIVCQMHGGDIREVLEEAPDDTRDLLKRMKFKNSVTHDEMARDIAPIPLKAHGHRTKMLKILNGSQTNFVIYDKNPNIILMDREKDRLQQQLAANQLADGTEILNRTEIFAREISFLGDKLDLGNPHTRELYEDYFLSTVNKLNSRVEPLRNFKERMKGGPHA